MKVVTGYFRKKIKALFDRIKNEKIKQSLLQAFPFWVGSVVTGIISVLFTKLFGLAEKGAAFFLLNYHWYLIIITPVCFFTAVWLVKRFAPYARGSGIPQVMTAIELSTPADGDKVPALLSIRIILIKVVSSCMIALGGGITGREGPTIQIAASIFRKINMWLPAWWPKISRRNMIITGGAAGLAAAFNTPLGGIVFVIEELTKTHISFYKTAIFSAVIIAGLTAQLFLGPYLYFGFPDVNDVTWTIFFGVVLVAIIAGFAAAAMSRSAFRLLKWKAQLKTKWKTGSYVLTCSMIVVVIAIFAGQACMNSGKELITQVLFTSDKHIHWYIPLIRIVGTLATFTSGAAGGIFAPALSAGAAVGSVFSGWLHLGAADSNLLVLAGMVGFLTGVTRSPFTSAILVLEMTSGNHVIFHLMTAALAANLVAYFIDRKSLYEHLKHQYTHELKTEPSVLPIM